MPGKKRGRDEGEEEQQEGLKRGKDDDFGDISPNRRPSSRSSDKEGRSLTAVCANGHPLVLVSKEVRRLEKESVWSCHSTTCKHGNKTESYMDRQRYRCCHYQSGGNCNFDLCEDCYNNTKETHFNNTKGFSETRRSSREPKPKYNTSRDGEWLVSTKFQGKRPGGNDSSQSINKQSPRSASSTTAQTSPKRTEQRRSGGSVRSNGHAENIGERLHRRSESCSPHHSSPVVGRSTRSCRNSGGNGASPTPLTAAGRSPRASTRLAGGGGCKEESESEEEEDDSDRNIQPSVSPDFYPAVANHVRFSPSVKNGSSPFGRKTRSGRRGTSGSRASYLQSLPSEDEQSEFNRQYSRDLRKRQARKMSEEGQQEEHQQTEQRSQRSRNNGVDVDGFEGINELRQGQRKRSHRAQAIVSYDEGIENGVEEEEEEEDQIEEQQESMHTRRRSRRFSESQSEHEATLVLERPRRKGRVQRMVESESEEEQSQSTRRRSQRSKKDEENTEDEDEADPTVTEASARRSRRGGRSTRRQVEPDDADTESGLDKHDEEETEETEGDSGDEGRRRGARTRRTVADVSAVGVGAGGSGRRSSRRTRVPVNRLHYDAPPEQITNNKILNMDKYCSEDDFNGSASPKKKKYSLRERRANTNLYQAAEQNGDGVSSKDRSLIRRTAMREGYGCSSRGDRGSRPRSSRARNGTGSNSRRIPKTGDSSSPSSSDGSSDDDEKFDKRKTKRMLIERDKLRPLNLGKKEVDKAIFKERAKVGASLADVQPMEMDMGVTFDSIGGLKEYVNSLKEMVMFPLLYPELFERFKIVPPRGVLFYGPPGTGKTLLARALACECSTDNRKVAFFMRKGADCLSKWIGESERQLRLLFDQAYQMRPSIIFFDEIDGLAPVRSSRQDQIHSSIVSTLLALMDGLDSRGEIVVIGATNRIENIDPALRRPGRFDRELRFSLPSRATRKEILQLHTRDWQPPVSQPLVNFLAAKTIGYCGADLKGLVAEAALNALRRRYPQVYESSKKLAITLDQVQVQRTDFDKALRKIVPSTHRVEDKTLAPLSKHIRPLMEPTYLNLVANIKRVFPHSAAGKGAVLPSTLTHRPRLLLVGSTGGGQGQTTYLGPALLHFLEKFPCQKLDIPALFSNSARTPEEACTQIIHTARRTMPGVLYIPHLSMLWETISETVRATLTTLLTDIPPTAPLLLLAVAACPYNALAPELQAMFLPFYREVYRLENPGENERREYFRPLIVSCSALPPKPAPTAEAAGKLEELPVLPEPECRKLTAREEKRLRRKEDALLRELRIFLRDIWAKINRESKFFMFRSPVNTEEVDDYLQYVTNPMDFEKMHVKLDDGEYKCAQDFLDDIDLIANNATAYNCDLGYETNRIICHRARHLQDFAYALVKAEMDTDFEDECKEIVERRVKVSEKLKKISKEQPDTNNGSPSKMQEMLAIVSLACKICGKTSDDSNMLICDGCDQGHHMYCTEPAITEVPEGDWFCASCVSLGVDKVPDTEGNCESPVDGSGGQKKKKRRRSLWSSGVIGSVKKKSVKKKLLDNSEDKSGEKQDDLDSSAATEMASADGCHNSRALHADSTVHEKIGQYSLEDKNDVESLIPTPVDNNQLEPSALAPALIREETPSEPTGVRIDFNKLMVLHNEIVRLTDGFYVEKLERSYAILAKVVRTYRHQFDRTNLPTDLQAELDGIHQQERIPDHTARIRR